MAPGGLYGSPMECWGCVLYTLVDLGGDPVLPSMVEQPPGGSRAHFAGCFFDNAEGAKAAFQNCPKLKAALEATDALPQLKEYISKRKETPF